MNRLVVSICVLLLVACGGGSGGSGSQQQQQQTSAESVASNSSDFPGLTKCSESGSWDNYLKAEQAKNPSQYTSDKSQWDKLKAGGADDGYVVVYADQTSSCANFGSDTPSGKVANVYAVRFKDESTASASFKADSKDFHLSDSDLSSITAAGGKVQQGAATGLGANSIAVELSLAGTAFYIAFWQNKNFEVAMIVYNVAVTDSESAAQKVNGRIK